MSSTGFIRVNIVPAPPAPPQVTLYDSAIRPEAEVGLDGVAVGDRWEGGFKWVPRQCPALTARNECAPLGTATYREGADSGQRTHLPTILVAENPCESALANGYAFERQSAIDALIAGEAAGAEAELWDGPLARAALNAPDGGNSGYGENLWLTKHGVAEDLTPTPGTGVTPIRALSILEDFLASSGHGGRGMIHFTRGIPSFLNYDLRPAGAQLLSAVNTLIVPGVGYTGNGPAAAAYAERSVSDAVLNSTTTVTSATAAFVSGDVGKHVSGAGIPAGTTIASRTNGTTVVLSQAATVSGSGKTITVYGGGDPVAPADGTVWAYATDQVTYRQGEIQVFPDDVSQALDRSTNSLAITAQRSVAATWDLCSVGAVLIELPA